MSASSSQSVTTGVTAGPVTLVVPSNPAMVRVGRLTASSLASLADLTIDDIDDIKIAVSEVVTLLVECGSGEPVTLRFEADDDAFSIEGSTSGDELHQGSDEVALTAAVLDAVSDRHVVRFNDGLIAVSVTKLTVGRGATDRDR